MTRKYTPLAEITLANNDSEILFANIPNIYRDLMLVLNVRDANAGSFLLGRFNSDSGANYSRVVMRGDGSSPTSFAQGGLTSLDIGGMQSTGWSSLIFHIMDYSATNKPKTVLARFNSPTESIHSPVAAGAYLWASNSVISTILLYPLSSSWATGSTLSLYGVR